MAVSQGVRRLLNVLKIEEEQCQAEMESTLGDLRRLEQALMATQEREREARRLVSASVASGEIADRLAGLEESRAALSRAALLKPKIAEAGAAASARQRDFLLKRVERRQAEAVIRRAEAQAAIEAGRRDQRQQDEWFLSKAQRGKPAGGALDGESRPESAEKVKA